MHTIKGELPDLEDVKFAIFGCKENRRDIDYMGLELYSLTLIRMSLYGLYPGNWKHTIVDLGDIEKGASVEDSYFAVKAVYAALLKKNIIPIILRRKPRRLVCAIPSYDGVAS